MPRAHRTADTLDLAYAEYQERLRSAHAQGAGHEGNVRKAFGRLLEDVSRKRGWTLVEEDTVLVGGGTRRIRYDGVLRDEWRLPHGYWEAKDSGDDLHAEIERKIRAGYSTENTIFENTITAILYQDGRAALTVDLRDNAALAALLKQFHEHVIAAYSSFGAAVEGLRQNVPELALALREKIEAAHAGNPHFQTAFEKFYTLCRTSLNPELRREAVDEMLIQHMLTERLIVTVFDQDNFGTRNVIAREIGSVIAELSRQHFNYRSFLGRLDRYYEAIEAAAAQFGDDFAQKQTFLNTVYERFFQGYAVDVADTHGIVYTPQPIVQFMCAAVEEVLADDFGMALGDPEVIVLDPATGTGNFIVQLINRIPLHRLRSAYEGQLFANEVMLLPYYVASLNIEHAYYARMGEYAPFDGVCFVDTLDMMKPAQMDMFMTEANTDRVKRQKKAAITVIIGNPPYNAWQQNENDNNKNRRYPVIEERLRATYVRDSSATLRNALYDPYVKFFRWATDRLGERDGIVCYVTNNSFVDQIAFDGMRRHLLSDFTRVYHIDLHGNVRQNPKLSGTTHNVFGIQVGVGITIAVRHKSHSERRLLYYRVPELWRRTEKLAWLTELIEAQPPAAGASANGEGAQSAARPLRRVAWQTLTPDARGTWLVAENADEWAGYVPMGTKAGKKKQHSNQSEESIFRIYSNGVKSNRDIFVYDFDASRLAYKAETFVEIYNRTVDIKRRSENKGSNTNLIDVRDVRIKWTRQLKHSLDQLVYSHYSLEHVRRALYRPFTTMYLYFDDFWNEDRYRQHKIFPTPATEAENRVIWLKVGAEWPMFALMANTIVDLLPQGGSQCFPFYTYDEDGSNRRENITDWALAQFQQQYGDAAISKWDVFHYVYALLHHPAYRVRFAANLKRDLPRIPYAPAFHAFAEAGRRLAALHVGYETVRAYDLDWKWRGAKADWRVTKMRWTDERSAIRVNETLTLGGMPATVHAYKLGSRSALDWVIDQYQVTTDRRTGIVSDPNRADEPEYIARLVCRVTTVSVETMAIIAGLPGWQG